MRDLAAFERGEILSRMSRLLAENRDDVARTLAGGSRQADPRRAHRNGSRRQ